MATRKESSVSALSSESFRRLLVLSLTVPLILTVAGWLVQAFFKFPPRSFASSLTAKAFAFAPMLEVFVVPFAIVMLAKRHELRTGVTVSMTIVGSLLMLWGLLILGLLFNR